MTKRKDKAAPKPKKADKGASRKAYYARYKAAHKHDASGPVPESYTPRNKSYCEIAATTQEESTTKKPDWRNTLQEYRAAKNREWHVKYEKRMKLKAAVAALETPSEARALWLNNPTIREQATHVYPHTRADYIAKGWIKAA